MTYLSTIAIPKADPADAGHLILVVGPSGAGKDTLINLARKACANSSDIVFARRIVTREASVYEDNTAVTSEIFQQMVSRGDFSLHWHAHGLSYGLPRSVLDDVQAGKIVVANVSRTVIEAARRIFTHITVVLVTAPPGVLADRLNKRNRDSDILSAERHVRAVAAVVPDVTINNVGVAEDHANELLHVIQERVKKPAQQNTGR